MSAAFLILAGGLYGQAKPTFASGTPVTNVGGGNNEFAPGSLAYVRGSNLATRAVSAEPPYPATLAGTTVTFTQSGTTFTAALLDAQPDRLTIQIPYGLKRGSATLKVTAAGGEVSRSLSIIEVAPRPVATQVMESFLQEAYHADGRGITEAEPARPGEEIRVLVQGLGETVPPIAAGQLPGDGSEDRPFNAVTGPISARFDQTEAEVRFARLAPGRPGLYEVGVVVPADVRAAQYLFAIRYGDGAWLSGGIIWAGWRVIRLTDTWNGQACEKVDSAPVEVPYDAYLNRLETWVEMPLGVSWVNFRLLNEAGEPVLSSVVSVQSCDGENPSWCLVGRGSLKVTLPAGTYTLELPPGDYTPEQGQPRLCRNAASRGQALSRLYGAWAPSNWSTAGEGVLAAEGGEVQAPGFVLTAEPGALEESAAIRVSTPVKQEEMSGGRITPYFRLEGLPVDLRAPVTLTLDAPGAPDGEVTLLMRAEDTAGAPVFLRGTVADGKLTVRLPVEDRPDVPEAGAGARFASARSASLTKSGKISWILWGMMGLKPNNHDEHFIIHAPSSANSLVHRVGKELEKAYRLIAAMGLDWSKRGDAPIEVYLFSYNSWSSLVLGGVPNTSGNTETGVWKKTNVGICLNLDVFSDESDPQKMEDLAITAGHELLHIMQAQYDNTGIVTSGWTWLFEAAAVWLERALASDPKFVSPHAKSNMYFLYTDPLEVQSWLGREAARRHGYGASLFLQQLAPAEPGVAPASVGDLIKLAAAEDPPLPVEALEKVYGPLHEAWWNFCDRYVGGSLIGTFPEFGLLTSGTVKPVNVTFSRNSTAMSDQRAFPHLSARLYRIQFDSANLPDFPRGAKLRFALTSLGLVKAFVYVQKGANWQRAGEFTSLFELGEIEALANAKGSVFLMVSNASSIYPYNGSTDVKVEVKLDGIFEGVTSYETTFHGVLYNQTYELDFRVTIRGTAPFQVARAEILSVLVLRVTTPPIDITTYVPGKEQVDRFTVTITYSNLKPGPKSFAWPAGMRLRAGFDSVSAMVEGAPTQSKEYAVVRGGSSVSGGFLTDLLWPEGNSTQGGAESPIRFDFTPKN